MSTQITNAKAQSGSNGSIGFYPDNKGWTINGNTITQIAPNYGIYFNELNFSAGQSLITDIGPAATRSLAGGDYTRFTLSKADGSAATTICLLWDGNTLNAYLPLANGNHNFIGALDPSDAASQLRWVPFDQPSGDQFAVQQQNSSGVWVSKAWVPLDPGFAAIASNAQFNSYNNTSGLKFTLVPQETTAAAAPLITGAVTTPGTAIVAGGGVQQLATTLTLSDGTTTTTRAATAADGSYTTDVGAFDGAFGGLHMPATAAAIQTAHARFLVPANGNQPAVSGNLVAVSVAAGVPGVVGSTTTPGPFQMPIGSAQQLEASFAGVWGAATTFTWVPLDATKITVSATGLAEALGSGSAKVRAVSTFDPTQYVEFGFTVPAPDGVVDLSEIADAFVARLGGSVVGQQVALMLAAFQQLAAPDAVATTSDLQTTVETATASAVVPVQTAVAALPAAVGAEVGTNLPGNLSDTVTASLAGIPGAVADATLQRTRNSEGWRELGVQGTVEARTWQLLAPNGSVVGTQGMHFLVGDDGQDLRCVGVDPFVPTATPVAGA